jgi:hypothetical protein
MVTENTVGERFVTRKLQYKNYSVCQLNVTPAHLIRKLKTKCKRITLFSRFCHRKAFTERHVIN